MGYCSVLHAFGFDKRNRRMGCSLHMGLEGKDTYEKEIENLLNDRSVMAMK